MTERGIWQVQLLGTLTLSRGERKITRFRTRRAGALVGFLALNEGRELTRDEVCMAIWPEASAEARRARLRQELSVLRRQIEEPGEELFLADRATLRLRPGAIQTDIARFKSLLAGLREAETSVLSEAVVIYRGPLLAGLSDGWAVAERKRLAELQAAALARLADLASMAGEVDAALAWAHRACAHDSTDEAALLRLVRLLDGAGRTREARHLFDDFAARQVPSAFALGVVRTLGRGERAPADPLPAPPVAEPSERFRLPQPLTRFFGREAELAWVEEAFSQGVRLVTITGPGGAGKTRLAVEAAHRVGGACFVGLASVDDERRVADRIAEALELPPAPRPAPLERTALALATMPEPLLIFDNCEQVLDGVAEAARTLLEKVAGLRILATSRQALQLGGERELALPSLATPDTTERDPERLWGIPAVRLFVDRAQATRRDFALTGRNAEAVGALCRRLDGMPLGLELAAAQVGLFSVEQLLERVEASLDTLQGRTRDLPARHRSLRAAIEGSVADLTDGARMFFARLSLFRGGWSRDAAEAVGDGALEHLETLRLRSLLLVAEQGGELRWSMLGPLRDFARMLLTDQERTEAEARHGAWFVAFAVRHTAELDALERERDNLRAASAWALKSDPAQVLTLVTALREFFHVRGPLSEGRALADAALSAAPDADPPLRAGAYYTAGFLARLAGDFDAARSHHEMALALYRQEKDIAGVATALNNLGVVARVTGDFHSAHIHYAEALALRRRLGDPRAICASLNNLGVVARATRDFEGARRRLTEALELARTLNQPLAEGAPLLNLGWTEADAGDFPAARAWFAQAVEIYASVGSRIALAEAGEGVAAVLTGEGTPGEAAVLWGGAERLRGALGTPLTPSDLAEQAPRQEVARAALGEEAFAAAWSEGHALAEESWLARLRTALRGLP